MESSNVTFVVIVPMNDNPPVIDTDGNSTLYVEDGTPVGIVGLNAAITDGDQFSDHMLIRDVQVRILNAANGEVSCPFPLQACVFQCIIFCHCTHA